MKSMNAIWCTNNAFRTGSYICKWILTHRRLEYNFSLWPRHQTLVTFQRFTNRCLLRKGGGGKNRNWCVNFQENLYTITLFLEVLQISFGGFPENSCLNCCFSCMKVNFHFPQLSYLSRSSYLLQPLLIIVGFQLSTLKLLQPAISEPVKLPIDLNFYDKSSIVFVLPNLSSFLVMLLWGSLYLILLFHLSHCSSYFQRINFCLILLQRIAFSLVFLNHPLQMFCAPFNILYLWLSFSFHPSSFIFDDLSSSFMLLHSPPTTLENLIVAKEPSF